MARARRDLPDSRWGDKREEEEEEEDKFAPPARLAPLGTEDLRETSPLFTGECRRSLRQKAKAPPVRAALVA